MKQGISKNSRAKIVESMGHYIYLKQYQHRANYRITRLKFPVPLNKSSADESSTLLRIDAVSRSLRHDDEPAEFREKSSAT